MLQADYYLRPFEKDFWFVCFASIVLAGSILSVLIRVVLKEEDERGLVDQIFIGLETICNQCGNDQIKTIPLRTLSFSLRISSFIVLGSFGAVVTSYLTVKIPLIPFTNRDEFIRNGKYRFGTNDEFIAQIMVSFD